MSLKQEFIDMVRLIAEPLEADFDYLCYSLEVDTMVDVCELDGTDVTYTECYDCEKQQDCTSRKCVTVDVAFSDYDEFNRLYVFNKKPPVDKGIRAIWNRKQMMAEIFDLKKELERFKDYDAKFSLHYDELLQYAKEFGEELKNEYFFFSVINTNILPIVFHKDSIKKDTGEYDFSSGGNFRTHGNQSIINVYYGDGEMDKIKRNIRHELLHYFLGMSGLKHSDDDAIFHFLCEKYDANAYKEMGETEQTLYDDLELALSEFEASFEEFILPSISIPECKSVESAKKDYVASMLYFTAAKEKNELFQDNSGHETNMRIGKQFIDMMFKCIEIKKSTCGTNSSDKMKI